MKRLAVFVPGLGKTSETFIARHVLDLAPGNTVAVVEEPVAAAGCEADWRGVPVFSLADARRLRLREQAGHAVASRLGLGAALEPHELRLRNFLGKHGVAVALGEYLDKSLRWIDLLQQWGIPFWGHAHGYDVSMVLSDAALAERYQDYNRSAGVITMSHASRATLLKLGLAPDKVSVIPYGVDLPELAGQKPPADGPIRVLATGRMVGKKAPILLLESFRRALALSPALELDYVGGGELLPAARQFVRAFDLSGRVRLHGTCPHAFVRQLLGQAHIFIQHSWTDPDTGDQEGLPVAILEAMAHGLPVVSTRHAGIPEAVEHGVSGLLVDEGDVDGMAQALAGLAAQPELRIRLGAMSRQTVENRFTWDHERRALAGLLGL